MTAVVLVWLDGPDVYVSDVAGTPRPIATGAVKALARRANQRDDAQVKYGPDWFHRDALLSAAELVESQPLCANCHEAPGTQPMGDDNTPFCPPCCSAARGSHHDDKEDWS